MHRRAASTSRSRASSSGAPKAKKSCPSRPSTATNCSEAELPEKCIRKVLSYLTLKERVQAERVCKLWKKVSTQMWRDCTTLHARDLMVDAKRVPQCQRFLKSDADESDSDMEDFFDCHFKGDSDDEESAWKNHFIRHSYEGAAGEEESSSTDSDALSDCNDDSLIFAADYSLSSSSESDCDFSFFGASAFFGSKKRKVHKYKDYEHVEDYEEAQVLHPDAFRRILMLTKGKLKELNCFHSESSVGMSIVLPLVTKLCPNLEVLKISHVDANAKVVRSLGNRCPKLRILTLKRVSCLTDGVLAYILCRLKNLEHLTVSFNDKLEGTFVNYLKKETLALDVGFCDKFVGTYLVKAIKEQGLQFKKLTLSGLKKLTTNDFKAICHNLAESLEYLHIRAYENNPLINFADIRRLKNLKYLHLVNCTDVSDSAIQKIPKYCQKLEVVDFAGATDTHDDCANVTYDGLSPFTQLPYLKKLDVSGIYFEDDLLEILAENAHNLKHLVCKDCHSISNEGVIHLLSKHDQLEYLDVGGCESISASAILTKISPIINARPSGVPLKLRVNWVRQMPREQFMDFNTPMLQLPLFDDLNKESDEEDY